jgi:hypothetical protein
MSSSDNVFTDMVGDLTTAVLAGCPASNANGVF